ncbi:vancomycin resistance protein VanJ [Promicromonospora umidemergens]|uniref:Endonuclease/exonuclease/phosphatase family protein n=1 Tax=Promicromonospora umidemergens TaxID=629679 RepID=A0ABP8X3W6_9MICO|nr:endonuclease/exonuclease/phosphatase family protein [Promicromonospora umidemergens]MCP2281162.1 vancomycin resistance protein VanJ [Promicromonospora umidemergens]
MTVDAKHAIHTGGPAKTAWQRGRLLALGSVAVAALLVAHDLVPNRWGNLGSLVQTFLPWLGLAVPLGILAALLRRSALAILAVLLPLAAWIWVFLPQLRPVVPEPGDLTVVQHNVSDTNTEVAGTAEVLLAAEPDVVTLTEVSDATAEKYTRAFGDVLPHHETQGTVGVWSRYPLKGATAVDIRPEGIDASWDRCLRVVIQRDGAPVALFAAHLPSVRLGSGGFQTELRNTSALQLADAVNAERHDTVIVSGDLNGVLADGAMAPLTNLVTAPATGFELTYPEVFPVAQIDHVLARGATVTEVRALGRTGSDHLPLVAHVDTPWS